MQRIFQWVELGDDDQPVTRTTTDEEILRDYFPWWSAQMRRAGKPEADITPAHCVDDFVTVHWACEVEAE